MHTVKELSTNKKPRVVHSNLSKNVNELVPLQIQSYPAVVNPLVVTWPTVVQPTPVALLLFSFLVTFLHRYLYIELELVLKDTLLLLLVFQIFLLVLEMLCVRSGFHKKKLISGVEDCSGSSTDIVAVHRKSQLVVPRARVVPTYLGGEERQ